ncbi:MAG: hypothetical protein AAF962_08955 [Actinomycetota bacterium]
MQKLLHGVARYAVDVHPDKQARFDGLATGQSPEVLLITTADLRLGPAGSMDPMPQVGFVEVPSCPAGAFLRFDPGVVIVDRSTPNSASRLRRTRAMSSLRPESHARRQPDQPAT